MSDANPDEDLAAKGERLRREFSTLSDELIFSNVSLSKQVEDLTNTVAAWKGLHAQEATSRKQLLKECAADKKALSDELEACRLELEQEKEKSQLQQQAGTPLVVVLIDGDGALFDNKFLKSGREGGGRAAQQLKQQIVTHCSTSAPDLSGKECSYLVQIFLNQSGLAKTLSSGGIVSADMFQSFIRGFNEASPLMIMTDCGSVKEAADSKIKELLRLYISFPQCRLIILGGICHDSGYITTLSALKTDSLADKVVLLRSYSDMAFEISTLKFVSIELPGLFMKTKLNTPNGSTAQQQQPARHRRTRSTNNNNNSLPKVNANAKLSSPSPASSPVSVSKSHPLSRSESGTNALTLPSGSSNSSVSSPPPPPPLPPPITASSSSPSKRSSISNTMKPECFHFHLKGNCPIARCVYSHEPITDQERERLRARFENVMKIKLVPAPAMVMPPLTFPTLSIVPPPPPPPPINTFGLISPSQVMLPPQHPSTIPLETFAPLVSAIIRHNSAPTPTPTPTGDKNPLLPSTPSALQSRLGMDDELKIEYESRGYTRLQFYLISAVQCGVIVRETSSSSGMSGIERVRMTEEGLKAYGIVCK